MANYFDTFQLRHFNEKPKKVISRVQCNRSLSSSNKLGIIMKTPRLTNEPRSGYCSGSRADNDRGRGEEIYGALFIRHRVKFDAATVLILCRIELYDFRLFTFIKLDCAVVETINNMSRC